MGPVVCSFMTSRNSTELHMVQEAHEDGVGEVGELHLASLAAGEIEKGDPGFLLGVHQKASSRCSISLKQKTGPSVQT